MVDILDGLGSHRPAAERDAACRLVKLGKLYLPEIRSAGRSHRNAHARYVALFALARLAEKRASGALFRALDDPATPVRQHALMALHRYSWTTSAPERIARALDDER